MSRATFFLDKIQRGATNKKCPNAPRTHTSPKKTGKTQNSARQGVKTKPNLTYPSKTRGGLQTKVVDLMKLEV